MGRKGREKAKERRRRALRLKAKRVRNWWTKK
jgi:hypothetical protein